MAQDVNFAIQVNLNSSMAIHLGNGYGISNSGRIV